MASCTPPLSPPECWWWLSRPTCWTGSSRGGGGRPARRAGSSVHTPAHAFVTAGLAAMAGRGAAPWLLPVLVVAAFAQYVADSYWLHRGQSLRTSRLGRWNGILYFVPLVVDILIRLGWTGLWPVLTLLVWALVVSTVVSMGERLWAVRGLRRTARA